MNSLRHLYVHIPFCHRICPYCAFYKHQPGAAHYPEFVDAILSQATWWAENDSVALETLYFGGGTPSMLPTAELERLVTGLTDIFSGNEIKECVLEANPRTFNRKKAAAFLSAGVNRVSLGVQSWQPHLLHVLGRDHSPEEARESVQILRDVNCRNLNIDMMFSLPSQSEGDWRSDLQTTVELKPEHISCYNLNYEEDTEFFERVKSGEFQDTEDENSHLFYFAEDYLGDKAYTHYETSNYARSGFESSHNHAYWSGQDYAGLGPGAVSTRKNRRWKNIPDTDTYVRMAKQGKWRELEHEQETLDSRTYHNEAVALQLRTAGGLPEARLHPDVRNQAELFAQEGLVVIEGGRIRLTRRGRALVDPIAGELMLT